MKIFLYFAKLIRTHLSGGGSRGICICFCILEEVVDLAQLHVGPTQTDPIGIHFVVSSSVLTHSPGNDIIFLYKSPFHQNIARGTTDPGYRVYKGTPPEKKNVFFRALPEFPPPLSLSFGQLVHLFWSSKLNIYIVFFNSGKGLPPPHSGNARKKTFFFWEVFPYV